MLYKQSFSREVHILICRAIAIHIVYLNYQNAAATFKHRKRSRDENETKVRPITPLSFFFLGTWAGTRLKRRLEGRRVSPLEVIFPRVPTSLVPHPRQGVGCVRHPPRGGSSASVRILSLAAAAASGGSTAVARKASAGRGESVLVPGRGVTSSCSAAVRIFTVTTGADTVAAATRPGGAAFPPPAASIRSRGDERGFGFPRL